MRVTNSGQLNSLIPILLEPAHRHTLSFIRSHKVTLTEAINDQANVDQRKCLKADIFFQKLKKLKPLFNFKCIITGSKLIVRFYSKISHESIGKTVSKMKQK